MSSIKSKFPVTFHFSCEIPIRINDINYGGHVGNDRILLYAHEARVQFLAHHGYTELALGGTSILLTRASLEIRKEIFFGDKLVVSVAAIDFTSKGFELIYKMERLGKNENELVAAVLTSQMCYNYQAKQTELVPAEVQQKLTH
jgi:acyl-CoA thioester hydrolase